MCVCNCSPSKYPAPFVIWGLRGAISSAINSEGKTFFFRYMSIAGQSIVIYIYIYIYIYPISDSPIVRVWYLTSDSPIVFLTCRPNIRYSDSPIVLKMCSDSPYSGFPIVFEKNMAAKTMQGSFVRQTEKKQIFPARFQPMSS